MTKAKTKFTINDYALIGPKGRGDGREGPRWDGLIHLGRVKVATVHCDGDGGCLRWIWEHGPTGARRHDDFRSALAAWVKELLPGSELKEFNEPDAAWVYAVMEAQGSQTNRDYLGRQTLKMSLLPVPKQHAPNWDVLHNRLFNMVHGMKLGYSTMWSLGIPLLDLLNNQKTAIQRIEAWMAEGCVDVDSWQTLDNRCGGMVPVWCSYNAASMDDDIRLAFGNFVEVTKWDTQTPQPVLLTVFHRKPVFEADLPQEQRN